MARAGLTPERVVEAGAELADEIGFEHVTTTEVARRLGVQPASLYSHVGGTTDLRVRIALLALDQLAGLTSDAVAGRSGREALVALADAFRDHARAHPGLHAAARHRLDAATAAASAGPRIARTTRAVLRGYGLAEADEVHAVRLVGSVVHGWIALEQSGAFDHSDPPSGDSWGRALDALHDALARWAA